MDYQHIDCGIGGVIPRRYYYAAKNDRATVSMRRWATLYIRRWEVLERRMRRSNVRMYDEDGMSFRPGGSYSNNNSGVGKPRPQDESGSKNDIRHLASKPVFPTKSILQGSFPIGRGNSKDDFETAGAKP